MKVDFYFYITVVLNAASGWEVAANVSKKLQLKRPVSKFYYGDIGVLCGEWSPALDSALKIVFGCSNQSRLALDVSCLEVGDITVDDDGNVKLTMPWERAVVLLAKKLTRES